MKHLLLTLMITAFSLTPLVSKAITLAIDTPPPPTESTSSERSVRATLTARFADGKIETSEGSFSTRSAELKDHRPIDDWYKTPANAEVSLYFDNDRLVRVVIY